MHHIGVTSCTFDKLKENISMNGEGYHLWPFKKHLLGYLFWFFLMSLPKLDEI